MTLDVGRDQVIAYRVAAQGFDGTPGVLDLGVQDTPYGSARLALAARRLDGGELVSAWSTRGAPHLHRPADLRRMGAALWPLSDADATARINVTPIKEGARLGLAAFTAAAEAMRDVVQEPMAKGDVSREVSARVPESLTFWCKTCDARHISGALFQQVGLASGTLLDPSGPKLYPMTDQPPVPSEAYGTGELLTAYLRLLGPATPAEAAKFLGTSQKEVKRAWPDDLTEVRVDGRPAWLPAEQVERLRAAPEPRLLRLLPPSDPYLQARDRTLLVPDKKHEKTVWGVIGNPGALLVDGEIAGTWRARKAGKDRLDLTVTPFAATRLDGLDQEAGRLAEARGLADVRVLVAD